MCLPEYQTLRENNMKKKILRSDQIRLIEKLTFEQYGISPLILMENAGRKTADAAGKELRSIKGKGLLKKKVVCFCGKGNNGGDGFVAARYLFNAGYDVSIWHFGSPDKYTIESFTNFLVLCKMDIALHTCDQFEEAERAIKQSDLIVDAILGIGIKGVVREIEAKYIELINRHSKFVLSVDVPSGLDADSGEICGIAIKADATVSFGFAKKGFYEGIGPDYCGKIDIVDIGLAEQ